MLKNAQVLEMAKQVFEDQKAWVHGALMRLLPAKHREMVDKKMVSLKQMQEWARQNGIQITFFRDSAMIEIFIKGVLVDRFIPQLQVDGRPVDVFKLKHPEQFGDDIWVDGEGPKGLKQIKQSNN